MEGNDVGDEMLVGHYARTLSLHDVQMLRNQDSRLVSDYKARKLEAEAKKNWDLFYKRNSTHFFKDRHWTRREFDELVSCGSSGICEGSPKKLLEVGCGVGNFIYPLLEERLDAFFYACDISHVAIDLLKNHPLYSDSSIKAFQCDVTTDDILKEIPPQSLDVITLIFVLSAIHPEKFESTLLNLYQLLKPGGVVLFRDYGLYDMAQLRFKAGHKIADNFYMRQDGTRSYYFSEQYLKKLFTAVGFKISTVSYVQRRTVNKKNDIDVPRIFIQAKCFKPED